MNCKNCGYELSPEATSCENCGAKLEVNANTEETQAAMSPNEAPLKPKKNNRLSQCSLHRDSLTYSLYSYHS